MDLKHRPGAFKPSPSMLTAASCRMRRWRASARHLATSEPR